MTVKSLTTTTSYPYQKFFWILSYLLLALVVLYFYFVVAIIIGAYGRENLRAEFGALQSSVNQLESDYVILSGNVTIDLARSLGYRDAADYSSFAYQTEASGIVLSYRR